MKESNANQLAKIFSGFVLIRSGNKEYLDTIENFKLDSGEDFESLPNGIIGRSYIPREKHRIVDGIEAIQLPLPWEYGDSLFPRVASLIAAKEARLGIPVPPAPPGLQEKRAAALESVLQRLANGPDASQEEKDYQDQRGQSG
jgi:hypothetical protein